MIPSKHLRLALFAVFSLLISSSVLLAQETYFAGYQETISGTGYTYHSPYSNREAALISRAQASFPPIEWTTQTVPEDYQEETVSFTWLYGLGVGTQSQSFDLYVNDQQLLTFSNPLDNDKNIWQIQGLQGSRLTFNRSMVDKNGDEMGYAVLTVPTSSLKLGAGARLKVDGVDQQSNAWYMTFKVPLEEKFTVQQLKTVIKEAGQLFHTVRFNFVHLSDPAKAKISVGKLKKEFVLTNGLNEIDLLFPAVDQATELKAKINIENRVSQNEVIKLEPIREWTVHLVQHSHTDIGYTRPQSEILAEHLRYIDYALDYCDQTDNYPEDAQFRWTCEASWTVREYFENRPKNQVDRLLQRIKEGRIEVTGMFFNFSEIIDETALAIQTQTIKKFKEKGIDVTTAMQNDVNGIGWCMIDFYKNTGVKYLTMGQHGHRAQIPFDKPTSFWWESSAGNRLLAYRSEHYMHGNALSLTSGRMDVFRNNLSEYLGKLEQKGYPLDRTAFQFSGYITDNSPPSTKACDIVKAWNEKYEWPKLKLSLASEFMVFLDENHSDQLVTKKEAWPDWWTDGFGSAMNETKTSRSTHADMIANMGLLSMAQMMGAEIPKAIHQDVAQCYDNLLLYDEHTFGAAESIRDPSSENSVNQWRQKSSYVWSAAQQSGLLQEKAMGLIQPFIQKSELPTITVFNTLNWNRSGLISVFIDHDILPPGKAFDILDVKGKAIPAQRISSRGEGSRWALWVEGIPSIGFATLKIQLKDQVLETAPATTTSFSGKLENDYYQLEIDLEKGGVSSLFDKKLQKELLDPNREVNLGNFIYEQLDNRHTMERLTNDHRDTTYIPLKKKISYLSNLQLIKTEEGPIWKSVFLNGKIADCADDRGVDIEIRLYSYTKKVELLYSMRKLPVTDPEGVYIAFPFGMTTQDQLSFEAQGGTVYPGINQLEGTASDWNTVQNFVAVQNNDAQIVFTTNDIPLVQFGAINTGRFYYQHQPKTSHFYSWVLNNYWTTNFRASQEGELKWRYLLSSSNDRSNSFATRFGWENRIPMIARVMPGGYNAKEYIAQSILDLNAPKNLLLVNARPMEDGSGVLLHLRETEGDHAMLDITKILQHANIETITEVNVLGETLHTLDGPLLIEHFETKFLLLKMRE